MATLGTQNISTSYPQLLKTDDLGGISGTLQAITDGDNTATALELSTAGVRSTGTLNAAGATTLSSSLAVTGAVTLSSSLGVTGAATLSSSLGVTGAATLSSSLGVTGAVTLSSSLGVTGVATFSTSINASSGTATIGTIASTTINNTGLGTTGTLQVGASGPKLTAVTFATAAYTGGTVLDIDHATTGSNVSTGTLAASGVALGDMVIGNINSIGSTTGATPAGLLQDFRVEAAGVLRFTIFNSTQTTGTIPAGTIFATALRFTA